MKHLEEIIDRSNRLQDFDVKMDEKSKHQRDEKKHDVVKQGKKIVKEHEIIDDFSKKQEVLEVV